MLLLHACVCRTSFQEHLFAVMRFMKERKLNVKTQRRVATYHNVLWQAYKLDRLRSSRCISLADQLWRIYLIHSLSGCYKRSLGLHELESRMFGCPSVRPSFCLSLCLSVCLFVCLSVA